MKKKTTQKEIVLRHMKNFGCITSLEAFHSYKITRLAARIDDLRKLGYGIITDIIIKDDKHYASYRFTSSEDLIHDQKDLLEDILENIAPTVEGLVV